MLNRKEMLNPDEKRNIYRCNVNETNDSQYIETIQNFFKSFSLEC